MANIRLENIWVRFKKNDVLKNISFEAQDGELCVLVGPSGCGKSLILRVIAGLTKPYKGKVYIDEKLVNEVAPGDRDVSMVFQSYALYPNLTVRENLEFPLRAAKLDHEVVKQKIKEVTELLNMEELLNRYPNELSGGQQQRVATGRALVRRPKVFLLDEPLGNLDAKIRGETRGRLKRLVKDLGITTIYVTHDHVEAQSMGDKIIVLNEGIIQQIGDPTEIYENPVNSFVAEFIGYPRINFIDCNLNEINGNIVLKCPDFDFILSDRESKKIKDLNLSNKSIIMGIRPEKILISSENTKKTNIQAKIILIEDQSDEYLLDIELKSLFMRCRIKREKMPFEPEINQRIFIGFNKDNILLFEKDSGLRI